jgi:acyl dehydratase
MARTLIVRYQTHPQASDENARLVEAVFAALAEQTPAGLDYSAYRLADGVSFVHVARLDSDDNPLSVLPAFAEFQKGLPERCAQPPEPRTATVIGRYP